MPANPEDFVRNALDRLAAAVEDRTSPFRTMQFATASPEARPGLRTVILRAFDPDGPIVEFHTDREAGKCRELAFSTSAAVLVWSADDKLQLRLEGRARLHAEDEIARARWNDLGDGARAAYGFMARPGTPIDDPDRPPRIEHDAARFARFAVVRLEVETIEVLGLFGEVGQTRARTTCRPAGRASWVCP